MDETRTMIAQELPMLRRYARALRKDGGADDLVQDCLERALRKQDLWQRGTNLRAWLVRILYNLHLSSLRSAKRVPTTIPLDDMVPAGTKGAQMETVQLTELAAALRALPPEQQAVVRLVALEGLRYEEAAVRLAISSGTVRSRLSRARAALRQALGEGLRAVPPPDRERRAS